MQKEKEKKRRDARAPAPAREAFWLIFHYVTRQAAGFGAEPGNTTKSIM
jgi:hypothetical protein